MSELEEYGINLAEVVKKYADKEVEVREEELLKSEEEGDLRVFDSLEECFFWINDEHTSLISVAKDFLEITSASFDHPKQTLLDYYFARDSRVVELDDGQVIFIYE